MHLRWLNLTLSAYQIMMPTQVHVHYEPCKQQSHYLTLRQFNIYMQYIDTQYTKGKIKKTLLEKNILCLCLVHIHVGVLEQAVGWFNLALEIVVEDKYTCTYLLQLHAPIAVQLYVHIDLQHVQ